MPARSAGPKKAITKRINLNGCPDWRTDMLNARLWVCENILGVELRGWQMDALKEFGDFPRPEVVYIQIPRKNGKSFFIAIMALTELILCDDWHQYAVSDSEKNLTSVFFRELESLINAANLQECLHVYASKVENPATNGFIELRASNYQAAQGINPMSVWVDELHLQRDDRLWNGMIMAGAARSDAMCMAITTPGYDSNSVCHEMYLQCKGGSLAGMIFEPDPEWGEEFDHTDPAFWTHSNPAGADDPTFIERMSKNLRLMPEHEFRRFRLGQWTASEGAWLPYGTCASLVTTEPFDRTRPCWLGFDGSYSGDASALVAVNDLGQVSVLGHWENPSLLVKGEVDKDWRVPRDEVMDAIHSAFSDLDVRSLVADPPYWQRELQELARLYRGKVTEFPTGVPSRMAPACTATYAALVERKVRFCGDTESLARHLNNCATKDTPHGTVIVKHQEWSPKKIDAAIALCLALSAALNTKVRHPAGAR